ncbi:ribosome recycling factor [bacterium]|nr:ribosome recycling factor [bacterium]
MPLQKNIKETKTRMEKSIDSFQHEIASVRTGTASSALVENIMVECYGSKMPVNQLASISTPEARTIIIQPWDMSNLSVIEKAIMKSDVGLTPNNDGKIIRINVPPLSEERRNEFIKLTKKLAEEARVAVRNIRRDANEHIKKLQKDKQITEDDERDGIEQVQKLTDGSIKKIDEILKHKEDALLEV